MQEELEQRSVAISIKAGKLTANLLKKALEKALHERLQRLTEHLDTAEVSEKSIDIVKEIKELHALARTLEQEGTSQDGDRNPPAPLRVIWAGQEPEDGPP